MDKELKRKLFFGILLGGAAIIIGIGFIWSKFINFGTLTLNAQPPYQVLFADSGENFLCESDNCTYKLKPGQQSAILKKESYQDELITFQLERWQEKVLEAKFSIKPYISEEESDAAAKNLLPKEYSYELLTENNRQILVSLENNERKEVALFQKPINVRKIIGNDKSVIIQDAAAPARVYIVDVLNRERRIIDSADLSGMENGKWSLGGRYFVFTKNNSPSLWLLDVDLSTVIDLSIEAELNNTFWTYDERLLFASNQLVTNTSFSGKYYNYISLLPDTGTTVNFVVYNPDEKSYSQIYSLDTLQALPQDLAASGNFDKIYFSEMSAAGPPKFFRISLKKI